MDTIINIYKFIFDQFQLYHKSSWADVIELYQTKSTNIFQFKTHKRYTAFVRINCKILRKSLILERCALGMILSLHFIIVRLKVKLSIRRKTAIMWFNAENLKS